VPTYPVAEVTGEKEESNSKESINEDIDAWTASRPTEPNPTTAATTLKLNSKKTSTRPETRRPAQTLALDNQHKTWYKKTSRQRSPSDREEASRH
jgi:hypothetical protein